MKKIEFGNLNAKYTVLYSVKEQETLFNNLIHECPFTSEKVVIFGQKKTLERKTAFCGDEGLSYKYAHHRKYASNWTPTLLKIKADLKSKCPHNFNCVLLNHYANGLQGMGWHSDDEPELGDDPPIVSISLGASRVFQFRDKELPLNKVSILLEPGSLLIMERGVQKKWQHQLPKQAKVLEPRINLTFRFIQN